MEWPLFVLLGLSINGTPEHQYSYEYTSSYGIHAEASGTPFYTPTHNILSTQFGLVFGKNTTLVVGYASAFTAPKLIRKPSLSLNLNHKIDFRSGWSMTLSITGRYEGSITHIPCTDSTGRLFHCYHGVTPSSPLFTYDFDTTAKALSRPTRGIEQLGILMEYVF